jgi:hypothetical protein
MSTVHSLIADMRPFVIASTLVLVPLARAAAQDATIVYRLGKDTLAVEQFTHTPNRLTGEVVSRSGPTVSRTQYEFAIANGHPTTGLVRRRQADGSVVPGSPTEVRFTFGRDSTKREIVWPDSAQTRWFAAPNAFVQLPVFAFAPYELIYDRGTSGRDSVAAIPIGGNSIGLVGLRAYSGDTLRMRPSPYDMLARFDRSGRLLFTDGVFTTNKAVGTRSTGTADIASIARAMKPTGVLSPRASAYAGFSRGPIFISYGRPAVRERTVWGGVLIPFDTIWRTGANEATHLATSKTITLGDMTLAPGLYSLWSQYTHNGMYLIVNRQVGQWGTEYDPRQDIGRVRMDMARTPEHVEDFTITVRQAGANRGAIDFAWGDSVATALFTVRP